MLVYQGVQSIYRVKENNKTLKEAPEKIISKLDFKCNFLRIGNEKEKWQRNLNFVLARTFSDVHADNCLSIYQALGYFCPNSQLFHGALFHDASQKLMT